MADTSTADVLASSTAAAQQAAAMIGGTFTQGVGYTPGTVTATADTTVDTSNSDAVMKALTDRLLKESGGTSSITSSADTVINSSIQSLKDAQTANEKGVNAQYDLAEQNLKNQSGVDITGAEEASNGFAVNMSVLRKMTLDTNNEVKDLELRRQEALSSGRVDMASKLADLQMQKLKFQADSEQQVFSNLLNVSQLFLQQQSEKRLQAQMVYDQQTKMADIALKYGISVKPGSTLQDMVNAALPYASKEERLNLTKLQAEIDATNRSNRTSATSSITAYTLSQAATIFNNMSHMDYANNKSTFYASQYVDANIYMKLRDDFAVANGGKTSTFDNQFAVRLSPQDRARLGIGKAAGVQADDQTQAIIDALTSGQ